MARYLNGQKFGFLTVVSKAKSVKTVHGTRVYWLCKCECGNEKEVLTGSLTQGKTTSCGFCKDHIRHKDAYISWMAMKSRCSNINDKDYVSYGGRGITVCLRWLTFKLFLLDMGDPPLDAISGERLSLDRIDVDGNYEPNNCKWSTRSEQQRNKRLHKVATNSCR